MTVAVALETLQDLFPSAETGVSADAIPFVRVPIEQLADTVQRVRVELGYRRFVDLTAVDRLQREGRFELVYLFYSMDQRAWLRLKTRVDDEAPSITPAVGVRFDGHPDQRRIMLPDDWQGHPLRRTESLGAEPVDFTVTRHVYGSDA